MSGFVTHVVNENPGGNAKVSNAPPKSTTQSDILGAIIGVPGYPFTQETLDKTFNNPNSGNLGGA